jgi:hypothetical protein
LIQKSGGGKHTMEILERVEYIKEKILLDDKKQNKKLFDIRRPMI